MYARYKNDEYLKQEFPLRRTFEPRTVRGQAANNQRRPCQLLKLPTNSIDSIIEIHVLLTHCSYCCQLIRMPTHCKHRPHHGYIEGSTLKKPLSRYFLKIQCGIHFELSQLWKQQKWKNFFLAICICVMFCPRTRYLKKLSNCWDISILDMEKWSQSLK